MKKPSKAPPPPPPPPRHQLKDRASPARSCYSLPRQTTGTGSNYAESVCSLPFSTRSLQPNINGWCSPAVSCYRSCQSESTNGINYIGPGSPCCRPSSCCQASYCCENQRNYYSPCQPTNNCLPIRSNSPSLSCHSHCSHVHQPAVMVPFRYKPLPTGQCAQQVENIVPPITPRRTPRPLLSISPMPTLKNKTNLRENKLQDRCKSINYRRHMEQHIENLFKYLRDREQRRTACEKDIASNTVSTIKALQAKRESQYLRSLRTRISKSDFDLLEHLGAGAIGTVWLVRKNSNLTCGPISKSTDETQPLLYAMKVVKTRQVYQQGHMAHVKAERDILAEADNEWIVKLFYSFQDRENLYFILEYIPGGDMMGLLSKKSRFEQDMARFYIAEISLALQFVHDMGFIHRDIKPDNILIDARGHIKLTDFGLCTGFRWTHDSRYYRDDTSNSNTNSYDNSYSPVDDDHPTITKALTQRQIEHSSRKRSLSLVGSPNYIAPEVLRQAFCRQETTNEKLCDWWSVGVILFEMVIGYCPFIDVQRLRKQCYNPAEDHPGHIQKRILDWPNHLSFDIILDNGKRPSAEVVDVMRGLLCEPEDRICQEGIVDLKKHPFFHGIDWENIRNTTAPYIPELNSAYDTQHFDKVMPGMTHHISSSGSFGMAPPPMIEWTYKNFPKT